MNGQALDIMNSAPKAWYKALIKGCQQEIKWQHTWLKDLSSPEGDVLIDWEAAYMLPYKVTRETKMQSFQYCIAHRIITCNKYLCDIRVRQDPFCALCGEKDTIVHFFASCPTVRTFWHKLNDWCENHLGFSISFLTKVERILGLANENGNPRTFMMTF